MKKTGMILFILLLMLSLSTGCSNQENSITESNNTTDNNLEQISNKASQSDADMLLTGTTALLTMKMKAF